jgi:hypothetical protein
VSFVISSKFTLPSILSLFFPNTRAANRLLIAYATDSVSQFKSQSSASVVCIVHMASRAAKMLRVD